MVSAARLPAATASITDFGPETASPPAKTPSSEVWSVTGSALKYRPWVAAPMCLTNSSSLVCPMAVMI